MRRIYGLFLLVALLLVGATNIWAQDDAPTCDAAATADVLAELVEALRTAENTIEALGAVRDAASIAAAACGGLNFTSDDEGLMPVIGPVVIPEGIYRAKLTTNGFFILELTVLDGSCGEGRRSSALVFATSRGEADEGLEVIFNSEGCETLFAISNVSDAWELSFEPLQ